MVGFGSFRLQSMRHFRRRTIIVLGVLAAVLLLGGGAVYAKLGGSIRPSTANDIDLQKGLVGWWKLDGNAKDSSPYRNTGVLENAPTPTTDREGQANGAYAFNAASSQDIAIPDAAAISLTGPMTICAWFNGTVQNTGGLLRGVVIKDIGGTAASNPIYGLQIIDGAVRFTTTTSANVSTSVAFTGLLDNTWYDACGVYDGSTDRIYVNGVAGANQAQGAPDDSTGALRIGQQKNGFNRYFTGSIDDVRLYNRVLSVSEMQTLSSQYQPGVQAARGENGLLGWWKLDGSTQDASPNRLKLTATNSPGLTTDRKGRSNAAYSFNGVTGTGSYLVDPGANHNQYDTGVGQARTYSVWFKAGVQAQTGSLIYKSGACIGWYVQLFPNGSVSGTITTGNSGCTGYNSYLATASDKRYDDNVWHLATMVVDRPNTTMKLYIDGTLKSSAVIDNTYSNDGGSLRLGTDWNDTNAFAGSLDDARIYSQALGATDIKALYDSYDSQINVLSNPTTGTSGGNINQGLVGYWNLNGNAKDSTPYRDNGTVNGATLTTDRKGRANSAYSLNGTSNFISVANANQLNISSTITLNAWIYPTSSGSLGGIVCKDISGTITSCPYELRYEIGGTPTFYITDGSDTVHSRGCGTTLSLNVWHMLTGVYDGSTMFLYLDGSLCVPTTAYSGAIATTTGVLEIGQQKNSLNRFFPGALDEIRVYNRALSATEIQTLYQSNN